MLADVLGHVDGLRCLLGQAECRLCHGLRASQQREHAAVVVAVRLDVKYEAAGNAVRDIDQSLKDLLIFFLADAEIRYAFYKLCHCGSSNIFLFFTIRSCRT